MTHNLGAHETLELHEVLCDTIDGINQFQLYRPYVRDQQLAQILDNQINFMTNEYNIMVSMVNHQGQSQAATYRTIQNVTPTYGLRNPAPSQPNASMNQMKDKDVASGMLGCAKSSASLRMKATLECADPQLRNAMVQGAKNCADQAYEVWTYMNNKGYYQVPTLKDTTMQTFINQYQPSQGIMQGQMNY